MRKTAWSKSSVPSDRIPPLRSTNTPPPNRSKGKAKESGPPKSKDVLKLETLLEGLRAGVGSKDPSGVCFCQARTHPLSPYTPLCTKCGFILCSLHAPAYPCPHCSNPLTTPPSKDALIDKIKQEIGDLLQREQEERERQKLEHEKAVGAFPTLATSTGYPEPIKPSQPRKVLSLNQQTRKVTVASYTALSIAAPSSPSSQEEAVYRVPRPPKEVDYVRGKLAIDGRRWENLRDGGIVYVPLPVISHPQGSGGGKKKGKRVPGS